MKRVAEIIFLRGINEEFGGYTAIYMTTAGTILKHYSNLEDMKIEQQSGYVIFKTDMGE